MKRLLILVICSLSWTLVIHAQVKNIKASVDNSGEKFMITYDLDKDGSIALWDVSVIVEIDGVEIIPSARALSGDIGQSIKYGRKKSFIWDAYIDVESIDGEVTFDIVAKQSIIQNPPNTDKIIGLGGVGVGTVLFGAGLATMNNSDVKTYNERCDPSVVDPATSADFVETNGESPCDRFYEPANDATKSGSTLAVIGGVAAVVGGYFLVKKPIYQKWLKTQNRIGLHLQPTFELNQNYHQSILGSTVGFRLTYTLGK
ncbi:MAG: hypothetical protein AAGJ18_03020 [Bacteroidota bacterium]